MKNYERTYDDTMFRETFEHGYTWLNGFLRNVRRFPRRIAVNDPATVRIWNYSELNAEANRLAHALASDGVGKNDVVMAVLTNCPEFCFSYIGPRKIGAILNPVNFNLASGELALLIEHNRPKVLIYAAVCADTVEEAVNAAGHKPVRCVMADNLIARKVPAGHISYYNYVLNRPETDPETDFQPHIYDEVLRLCTSGTTALPKSVPINDINEVLSAHDAIINYPLNPNDVCLNMTPWFHRGGCHCGGPCPVFYAGCGLVIARTFNPKQALKWVEKHGVTFLIGAPSTLELLTRAQERAHADLSGLKGLITMGAPLEKEACIRYMMALTPNIFNGYGTTETLCNSFLRPFDLPDAAGSVGSSALDDEVRVVRITGDGSDEENEGGNRFTDPEDLVPKDGVTVGEVIIRAPAKSTYSYYDDPESAAEKFSNGWMYTGDLAVWDERSYVTIRGRKDDMIIVSAENVYPAQIEEALTRFEKVADCIVTSVPDRLRGQEIVAYVVPADPSLTVKELNAFCRKEPMLSDYKAPRWYRFVDEIPLNATGKKLHREAKRMAAEDLAAGLLRDK